MRQLMSLVLAGLMFLSAVSILRADEGMWLPNRPPLEILKERYGFEPTPQFLELLQRASVRFPNGSGSFVSSQGLVFTNHHIAVDCAHKLSTAEDDIVKKGFIAPSQADERKCPDLELNVLETITDVTDKVQASVTPGMSTADAEKARRAAVNTLESDESKRAGLECEMISLWNGAQFHLYCYKKYTDVRLAFIPEVDVARFGGDPDNFEFPRFCLDFALLRAYENGQPAKPSAFFPWQTAPLTEGELLLVSGHPGRTERLNTVADVKFLRDTAFPTILNIIRRYEITLQQFSYEGREEARIVDDELFGWQNSRKAYMGLHAKLQDPAFLLEKVRVETELRERLAARPELAALYGNSWDEIATAQTKLIEVYPRLRMLERGNGFYSKLFDIARTIVRLSEERAKPNAERLREYSDAAIPSIEQELFSPASIYNNLEVATLGDSLSLLIDTLGGDDELVVKVLAGKSPRERAFELVSGTQLNDVEARKKLVAGGIDTVRASNDPLIQLALLVDTESRRVRQSADEANELKRQGYAKLVRAIRDLDGTASYPDATFTLRLSFGAAKSYEENSKAVPITTTFAGLYQRAEEHENLRPWQLPKLWLNRKNRLNLSTQFNFVSTNDITGGNSGSPVVNRKGEVVGIIFDSNIQSLGNEFSYPKTSKTQARAISVSSAGITEALRKIYKANTLADELGK